MPELAEFQDLFPGRSVTALEAAQIRRRGVTISGRQVMCSPNQADKALPRTLASDLLAFDIGEVMRRHKQAVSPTITPDDDGGTK
jgi:hypothetical protein